MLGRPAARWAEMERLGSAARRARALEQFTAELFREHRFRADAGPAGRTRPTDLVAVRGTEQYLVACLWRPDRATVDDLDAVRARLARDGRDLVGVVVSVAGFSGTALHDVVEHRDPPILLCSGDELRELAAGAGSLPELLWRKQDALLRSGTVWLDEPRRRRSRPRALPEATARFVPARDPDSPVISFGGHGPFVFALDLPVLDPGPAGHGLSLDVEPAVPDERGLEELLEELAGLGWATPDASWTIQQSGTAWHGLGPAAFRAELRRWRDRAAAEGAHPNEEIHYVDRCDGGFYSVRARLSADRARRATAVGLSFQLQGIPLDGSGLLRLGRGFGFRADAWYRPRVEPPVLRTRLPGDEADELKLLGVLVQEDHQPDAVHPARVTGIVAANPLAGVDRPDGADPVAEVLAGSEYLICALQDRHPFDGGQRRYRLTGLEHARSAGLLVVRPVATWTDPDDE